MIALLALLNVALLALPTNRLSPGTKIDGVSVGWLNRGQAQQKIQERLPPLEPFEITVSWENKTWSQSAQNLGIHRTIDDTLNTALQPITTLSILDRWIARWESLISRPNFSLRTELDPFAVEQWISPITQELEVPGERPQFAIQSGKVELKTGSLGQTVNKEAFIKEIAENPEEKTFELPVEPTNIPLSADGIIHAEQRQVAWQGKTLQIQGEPTDRPITINTATILSFLSLPEGYWQPAIQNTLSSLLKDWESVPQDAQWELQEGGKKLKTFVPHKSGRTLSWPELSEQVSQILQDLERSSSRSATIQVTFQETQPEKTLKEINDLGVEERIGFGVSTYTGSIPNRVYNVGLTSQRMDLTLVLPGEEFSFNGSIGEVSGRTGYRSAYVIKDGMTQLDDGGGVCQVSTTVFRAALNAGLPITRWKAHSYRVGYYEQNSQPGFDATVYAPSTDFRFLNDTQNALVVTSQADSQNQHMVVEIWGKSDGRQSEISDYKISNQRAAPEPNFVDDPSLPRGTRRQIDWAAPGATTKFTYTVKNADGSQRSQRDFVSNFRPWRAVYLVGTL